MPTRSMKVISGLAGAGALAIAGAALATSQTAPVVAHTVASTSTTQSSGFSGSHRMDGEKRRFVPASASETASVKQAIKAKDTSVTVHMVLKSSDGSFEAIGTKGAQHVRVRVSKDFKAITVETARWSGHDGHGRTGHRMGGTALSGQALTQVKNTVKAKDASLTVERAFKTPDGTIHVMARRSGQPVRLEVSKDMKTVTIGTHPGPAHHEHGERRFDLHAPNTSTAGKATPGGAAA